MTHSQGRRASHERYAAAHVLAPSTAWTSVLPVARAADAIPAGCDGALFRLLAFGDVDSDTSQQRRRSLMIDDDIPCEPVVLHPAAAGRHITHVAIKHRNRDRRVLDEQTESLLTIPHRRIGSFEVGCPFLNASLPNRHGCDAAPPQPLTIVMSLPMQGFRLSVIKSAEMRNCRNSPLFIRIDTSKFLTDLHISVDR
jgi:hypothetical protein